IFTGLMLRTFSAIVSDCVPLLVVQDALATKSPLNAAGPEVMLKVSFTLAPGGTGSMISMPLWLATEVQPAGTVMLNLTPAAGAPVVFLNVTVVSCED